MSKCYLLLREWEQRIPRRQSPQIRYCHPELASVSWKLTTAPPTPRPPPHPCLSGRQTARHAARDARGLAGRAAAVGDGCRAWRPGAQLRGPSPEAAARLSHHGMRTAGAAGSERHPWLLRSPKAPGARAWIPGHNDGIESRRPSGSRDHGPGRAVRSPSARGGGSVSAGHPRGSSTPTQSPRPRLGQAPGRHLCLPRVPCLGQRGDDGRGRVETRVVSTRDPSPPSGRYRRVSVRVSLSPPDVDRGPQVWRHVWCPTRERVPPASRGRRPGTAEPLQRPDGPRQTAPRWGAAPAESRGALRGRREEQKVGRLWRGVQRREQHGRRGGGGREDAGAPEIPPAPRRPRLCDPGFPGDGRRLCTPPRSSAVSLLIEEVGTPRRRRPGRGEDRFLCFKLLVCGDLSL